MPAPAPLADDVARVVALHVAVPVPVLEHVYGPATRAVIKKLSIPSPRGFKPVAPLLKVRDGEPMDAAKRYKVAGWAPVAASARAPPAA